MTMKTVKPLCPDCQSKQKTIDALETRIKNAVSAYRPLFAWAKAQGFQAVAHIVKEAIGPEVEKQ